MPRPDSQDWTNSSVKSGHFKSVICGHETSVLTHVDGREIRNFDLAKEAMDLAYGAQRLRTIIRHRHEFHPSLLIIHSGHKEFSEFRDRRLGMMSSMLDNLSERSALVSWFVRNPHRFVLPERKLLDDPLFEDDAYERVFAEYARQIRDINELSRSNGLPLLISTVVGNEAEWDPNRSLCSLERPSERETVKHDFANALGLLRSRDFSHAIEAFRKVTAVCPRMAEAHFGLGVNEH